MHVQLLFGCKCTAISILLLDKHLVCSWVHSAWDLKRRGGNRCLINSSMVIATNIWSSLHISASDALLYSAAVPPTLPLLRCAVSEQPYLFHPDMKHPVYLGKTLGHLCCAHFPFLCLSLKCRLLFSCWSPHQSEPHFSDGKFSAWVLSFEISGNWRHQPTIVLFTN